MKMNEMKMKLISIIIISSLVTVFSGCRGEKKAEEKALTLKGDDVVLARVNGSPVTRFELEQAVNSTLGKYSGSQLNEKNRRKILESLVASRAISQTIDKELGPEEKARLEKKLAAHREQLLVKMYLARHSTPAPVSHKMVKEYYEKHPERFGGKTIRDYEMIATKRRMKGSERDRLIQVLAKPLAHSDWKTWAGKLKQQGYEIDYRRGRIEPKLMKPAMKNFLAGLIKGEPSKLTFIDGFAYLARITKEQNVPPKSLASVKNRISKILAPVQLKKAVKKASDEVLKNAKVEYLKR